MVKGSSGTSGPIRLEYNGQSLTIKEWSEKTGIPKAVIRTRRNRGWSAERILTTEKSKGRCGYIYKGKPTSLRELSRMSGLSVGCIYNRLNDCDDMDVVLSTPINEWRNVRHGIEDGASLDRAQERWADEEWDLYEGELEEW